MANIVSRFYQNYVNLSEFVSRSIDKIQPKSIETQSWLSGHVLEVLFFQVLAPFSGAGNSMLEFLVGGLSLSISTGRTVKE